MNQPDLFRPERPVPPPRPMDPALARKHLNRTLNIARAAERMPWGPIDAKYWADMFPKLARLLPGEEAAALQAAFTAELERLRAISHR